MGAWIKLFEDGSKEIGTDHQIADGVASWTNGRLEGIKEVQLSNRVILASLSVPNTSWYQFDHFITQVDSRMTDPTRIYRVVQAEIKPHHKDMFLLKEWNGKYIFLVSVTPINGAESIVITDDMIGKWVTMILPERGLPYMNLSEKGKFYGNV